MDDTKRLAREIAAADTVVALTGAGISAPSGVPTFRGDDGVWDRFDRGDFEYDRFRRDPGGFWEDRLELHREMHGEAYEPNAAHEALAELGRAGHLDAIVTQNTDGLHDDAAPTTEVERGEGQIGSEKSGGVTGTDDARAEVIELHGNAHRIVCTDCERRFDAESVFERVVDGEVPPVCECGGVLKPDVVLFGERLPDVAGQRARSLARESDVFLAIGSSLVVEPAASLPRLAARNGATTAVVNLEATPRDDEAAYLLREDVTTVLPELRKAVEEAAG